VSTGQPVPIAGADGSYYTVDPKDLPQELAAGSRVATPEELAHRQALKQAGGAGGMADTAIGAAAGSIPFIGGALESHISSPIEREANPGMHALGTGLGVAGQVAGTVATGGLEGMLEGGGLLDTAAMSTAERAGARALLGAGEGSFYGAGGAVNDAVLGNHPLTGEMLLQNAAGGALLGAGLGGGLSLGGDYAAGALSRVGNSARTAALGSIVDSDVNELAQAGLGQPEINRAFREGLVQPGDTPAAVQGRLAEATQKNAQALQELGQKVDMSGQTFNLRQHLVDAGQTPGLTEPEGGLFASLIQPGDEAAPFTRVQQVREALSAQEQAVQMSEAGRSAAGGVRQALDDSIIQKLANLPGEAGDKARTLLSDQEGFLKPLVKITDAAVKSQHVPAGVASAPGGGLAALLREGVHFAGWTSIAKLDPHIGSAFMALSAANFLRKVVMNPGEIAGTYLKGLQGLAKATGKSQEALESAVGHALQGTYHAAGPVSAYESLILPHDATDQDVSRVRGNLTDAQKTMIAGNPNLTHPLMAQRGMLLKALPPPNANPNLPASMARPELGPSPKAINTYNDTLHGIAQPLQVIAHMGSGRASKDQVAAMRAAYPQISARAGHMLLNASADSGKMASPQLVRAIETLRGGKIDPATAPVKVARLQQVFAPAAAPGQGGANGSGSGMKLNQKGLSNIDVGERISRGMAGEPIDSSGKR
jgi:hypothetical protein